MRLEEIGHVTALKFYPVKSFGGIDLATMRVDLNGPANDRAFMVVDVHGRFLTQRSHPAMSLLRFEYSGPDWAQISGPTCVVKFSLQPRARRQVTVWQDSVAADTLDPAVDAFLSDYLETPCQMVALASADGRIKNKDGVSYQANFPDAAPFLLCNTASLAALQRKYDQSISMDNFRPNIVVDLKDEFVEERLSAIRIADVEFPVIYGCTRCKMINIEPGEGKVVYQLLQQMSRDRKPVVFGMRMIHQGSGELSVGDIVYGTWQ